MAEREAPNHPSSTRAINFTYTAASGEQIIFKDPGRLCDQPGYRERDYSKAMGYGGGDGGGGGMGGGGGGCGGDGGCQPFAFFFGSRFFLGGFWGSRGRATRGPATLPRRPAREDQQAGLAEAVLRPTPRQADPGSAPPSRASSNGHRGLNGKVGSSDRLALEIVLEEPRRLGLRAGMRCPQRSRVTLIEEWPMYVDSALALTPAAVMKEAQVWRQSCRPGVAEALGIGRLSTGIRVALTAVGLSAVLLALRSAHRGTQWITAAGWATLAVLLTTTWLYPWYVVSLLPLAALSSSRGLRGAALGLTGLVIAVRLPLALTSSF